MNEVIPEKASLGYRCHIALVREDDDDIYSAIVMNLPGCGSCGESEKQAIENAKEAILGTIASYIEANKEIPWIPQNMEATPECTVGTTWIIVNA